MTQTTNQNRGPITGFAAETIPLSRRIPGEIAMLFVSENRGAPVEYLNTRKLDIEPILEEGFGKIGKDFAVGFAKTSAKSGLDLLKKRLEKESYKDLKEFAREHVNEVSEIAAFEINSLRSYLMTVRLSDTTTFRNLYEMVGTAIVSIDVSSLSFDDSILKAQQGAQIREILVAEALVDTLLKDFEVGTNLWLSPENKEILKKSLLEPCINWCSGRMNGTEQISSIFQLKAEMTNACDGELPDKILQDVLNLSIKEAKGLNWTRIDVNTRKAKAKYLRAIDTKEDSPDSSLSEVKVNKVKVEPSIQATVRESLSEKVRELLSHQYPVVICQKFQDPQLRRAIDDVVKYCEKLRGPTDDEIMVALTVFSCKHGEFQSPLEWANSGKRYLYEQFMKSVGAR